MADAHGLAVHDPSSLGVLGRDLDLGRRPLELELRNALDRRAGEEGGTYPCAFNAANEVAVAAFLDGRLPFLGIAEVVEGTLNATDTAAAHNLDELVAMDAEARKTAAALTRELVH